MMTNTDSIETKRSRLRAEICDAHGLDPEQITFSGDSLAPIFDFEALSALALKLTDIRKIECATGWIESSVVTAKCVVELPDGRSRSVTASAFIDEELGSGGKVETLFQAEAVAHARATRRGIRAVGVNLLKAHRQWLETGSPISASGTGDPRLPLYQEVHILAKKVGLIVDSDRSRYEQFLALQFDGRTSTRDLDDRELDFFIKMLRLQEAVGPSKGH